MDETQYSRRLGSGRPIGDKNHELQDTNSAFLLLVAAILSAAMAIGSSGNGNAAKWLTSAGLIFDIAGIVQLELSGAFGRIFEKYSDEYNHPGGPPSAITRQIIDNPDTPIRTWLRNTLFFEHQTGVWLLVLGFVFQMGGDWI